MPNFDITLNVYFYLLSLGLSLVVGFWGRSRQLAKRRREVLQMEGEVVHANAETLEAQKKYLELEISYKNLTNPVITMKNSKLEESLPSPLTDREGLRKNRATGTD